MEIWRSFPEAVAGLAGRRTALTIGTFDGVHRGHRRVIDELCREARKQNLLSIALTFTDHPAAVVGTDSPPLLTTLEERLALLARSGLESALVIPFDDDLALTAPADFVRKRLCRDLCAALVVVGHDFRFGAGGEGDAELLARLGASEGCFTVRRVPPVVIDGVVVSSTAIRWALTAGEIEAANSYLGRPFALRGVVRHGAKRGRRLGYPTANIALTPGGLLPRYGVYLVNVRTGAGEHRGVADAGVKPTFGRHEPGIEVFLLDYDGDLYGAEVEVEFCRFLRPERVFPDADALRAQIEEDVRRARAMAAAPADSSSPCLHWI